MRRGTRGSRCRRCGRAYLRTARATGHAVCGWLAYRLGWHGVARQQFERVLLLRGAHFRAYVHLGRIAFDRGDYVGWRREFEHARRTDPIQFARLRHPIELFEPRLAGTQFEGASALDGFQATDSRATWRVLHPFQDPREFDPNKIGRVGDDLGNTDLGDHDLNKGGMLDGHPNKDDRTPDGYGRSTDLPLAPGYDPMASSQQLDDDEHSDLPSGIDIPTGNDLPNGPRPTDDPGKIDSLGLGADNHNRNGDASQYDAAHNLDPLNRPFTGHPSWNTPDASLSRDDFSSPTERRRFQLRRPIDSQEIARCDLNDLVRRLSN